MSGVVTGWRSSLRTQEALELCGDPYSAQLWTAVAVALRDIGLTVEAQRAAHLKDLAVSHHQRLQPLRELTTV